MRYGSEVRSWRLCCISPLIWSLRAEVSLVQQIAENKSDLKRLDARDRQVFFRAFTSVWAFYYPMRAGAFLWVNLQTDISQGFWTRLLIGKISFLALIALSTLGGRPLWKLASKLKLLPSLRNGRSTEPTLAAE